jgi:hypothetical protein
VFRVFYYISSHFISLHLDIEFRVNLMIYFGSSNHKKKKKKLEQKKQNGGENQKNA